MVSIMCPSGCGKTTLLNCLSGLDEPTTGSIRIDGTLLEHMSDKARAAAALPPGDAVLYSKSSLR